ncbi:hypothetical protein GCM10025868_32330 [Angustibacter aerolatus]|uniref:Uncharacterized protein n=1 Tax=Angustibacter aerolatus TaxID=1162965 RepID=A0ABQ6JIE6_9ACTN|nr:hypothetical protein [Angustibacter aerolatus]GMA87983.1 hypothetical protein GCM10025868_32330 [Angustibacter aerolatus]
MFSLPVVQALAVPADQRRLDRDALPHLHGGDVGPDGLDDADDLVARLVGRLDERVLAVRGVRVGAADAAHRRAHQRLGGRRLGLLDLVDGDPVGVHDHAAHLGHDGSPVLFVDG